MRQRPTIATARHPLGRVMPRVTLLARRVACLALVAVPVACDHPVTTLGPTASPYDTTGIHRVTWVSVTMDTAYLFPGDRRVVNIIPLCDTGPCDDIRITVTSSDTSVLRLAAGPPWSAWFGRAGSAVLTVSMTGGLAPVTLPLTVRTLPASSASLAIDSLIVANDWDYAGEAAYFPRLWVHAIGAGPAPVIEVALFEFRSVARQGWCRMQRPVGPASASLIGFDEPVAFAYYNGYTLAPPGLHAVRLLVREADGSLTRAELTSSTEGRIDRLYGTPLRGSPALDLACSS